jgi:hypothetical protein
VAAFALSVARTSGAAPLSGGCVVVVRAGHSQPPCTIRLLSGVCLNRDDHVLQLVDLAYLFRSRVADGMVRTLFAGTELLREPLDRLRPADQVALRLVARLGR